MNIQSKIVTMGNKEKILLAIVSFRGSDWTIEEVTHEMEELVLACQGEVVETIICKLDKPTANYLIGEGKVQEIVAAREASQADTVIFSHELKGSQQRNLEDAIKTKTIDRTQLILDIFARRATSQEGKMQVELAQLQYLRPRLVGHGVEFSRLGGGIGTRGPGETKLEVDRQRISERIDKLKQGLKDVSHERAIKRKKRKDQGIPLVSLIGYTNAGKSTLLNALTKAEQVVFDGLFTTLDPLARQLILPSHQKVILSDTVGFMHDLPHNLIEAFKATLEEVQEADLLVHVLDVSNPKFKNLADSVNQVLKDLEAADKPILMVLNKIDRIEDRSHVETLLGLYENVVSVSALKGENVPGLLEKLSQTLSSLSIDMQVTIPINRMDLINLAHQQGQVFSIKYYNDSIYLHAAVPPKLAGQLQKSAVKSE